MVGSSSLNAFWSFLCTCIALFYLFRFIGSWLWLRQSDRENEVGHGIMAIGMIVMLAPASLLTSDLIRWNILLFAGASVWWTCRLLVRKPLLALLLSKGEVLSSTQADAIHVLMHGGMCCMFFMMSSMAFSMTPLATYLNCLFFVSFAFLTFFYSREISKDLHAANVDWLQLGANIAHVLMSGIMSWMFIEMIAMTMRMGTH